MLDKGLDLAFHLFPTKGCLIKILSLCFSFLIFKTEILCLIYGVAFEDRVKWDNVSSSCPL